MCKRSVDRVILVNFVFILFQVVEFQIRSEIGKNLISHLNF
jgi:hypothetical protein